MPVTTNFGRPDVIYLLWSIVAPISYIDIVKYRDEQSETVDSQTMNPSCS